MLFGCYNISVNALGGICNNGYDNMTRGCWSCNNEYDNLLLVM